MNEETDVTCPVCGAMNEAGAAQCVACGFALKASTRETKVDALLEDLLDLSKSAPVEPVASEPDTSPPDADENVAEQLFDSLLVEIQPSEEAPKPKPVSLSVGRAPTGSAVLGDVPVLVTPAETEGGKLGRVSGRMVDFVTFGSIGALLAVFVFFRMYVNPFDPSNPLPMLVFSSVAVGGMATALVLHRISNSHVAQGDRLVKQGRYQDALLHYERAIRMVRRPSYAWTSRGVALKFLGRLDDALRCHENAIRLDPGNEVAWCNLGTVYFKKGELGKALECYDKAIGILPKYAIAWNNKGVVLARMNRFAEADRCHAKATKLRPEYVAAWLNRGEVLARLGSREEAERCLEKARSLGA